jgi:hypothetical protein
LSAGFIVLIFFFYEFAVPAAAGIVFIGFVLDLIKSIREINKVRRERIERERRI